MAQLDNAPLASPPPENVDADELSDNAQDESLAEDEVVPDVDPSERERFAHDETLHGFLAPLRVEESTLHQLARRFSTVYTHLALESKEQFLPTPVTKLPTGHETGRYLAIDVGGSNLRVSFIELLGDSAGAELSPNHYPKNASQKSRNTMLKARRQRVKRTLERAWPIGEHLKRDKADDLFAWIGDCIAEVVAESLTKDATKVRIPEELDMGITFSFPIM